MEPHIKISHSQEVRKFETTLENIRVGVVRSMAKKLSSKELELIESVTMEVMSRMARVPTSQIKTVDEIKRADHLSAGLNELFNPVYRKHVKP